VADEKRVRMAQVLVLSGYDPAEALVAVGLDPIAHTGLLRHNCNRWRRLTLRTRALFTRWSDADYY
jgi:hypothetical protein